MTDATFRIRPEALRDESPRKGLGEQSPLKFVVQHRVPVASLMPSANRRVVPRRLIDRSPATGPLKPQSFPHLRDGLWHRHSPAQAQPATQRRNSPEPFSDFPAVPTPDNVRSFLGKRQGDGPASRGRRGHGRNLLAVGLISCTVVSGQALAVTCESRDYTNCDVFRNGQASRAIWSPRRNGNDLVTDQPFISIAFLDASSSARPPLGNSWAVWSMRFHETAQHRAGAQPRPR